MDLSGLTMVSSVVNYESEFETIAAKLSPAQPGDIFMLHGKRAVLCGKTDDGRIHMRYDPDQGMAELDYSVDPMAFASGDVYFAQRPRRQQRNL